MTVYKDAKKGTWYTSFYFKNWKGDNERKMKRGFKTKREALDWERTFKSQKALDFDMHFVYFIDIYKKDIKKRVKYSTWLTKELIIDTKVTPYFKKKRMNKQRKVIVSFKCQISCQRKCKIIYRSYTN